MSIPFNPHAGLIMVRAWIRGPRGASAARLALDTGAATTAIHTSLLVRLGYDPAASPRRTAVSTGSGPEYVALLKLDELHALDQARPGLEVMAHALPPGAPVDGVLGLDFMRGLCLTVDFRAGEIALA